MAGIGNPTESGLPLSGGTVAGGLRLSGSSGAITFSSVAAANGITWYNTVDETTDYERFVMLVSGNRLFIAAQAGGAGVATRTIKIQAADNTGLIINAAAVVNLSGSASSNFVFANAANGAGVQFQTRQTSTAGVGCLTVDNSQASTSSLSATSGFQYGIYGNFAINQSTTAGYVAHLINVTETTTGSGAHYLADFELAGASKFGVLSSGASIFGNSAYVTGTVTLANTAQLVINNSAGTNIVGNGIRIGTADTSGLWFYYKAAGVLEFGLGDGSNFSALQAGTIRAGRDQGGVASLTSFTSATDVSARSTGVGSIFFSDATPRNCTGFIKIFTGTTARWIPFFDAS